MLPFVSKLCLFLGLFVLCESLSQAKGSLHTLPPSKILKLQA